MKGNLLLFIAIVCVVNGSIIVPAPYYPSFLNQQSQYFNPYSLNGVVSNPSITNSQIDLNDYSKMLSTLSFFFMPHLPFLSGFPVPSLGKVAPGQT